MTEPDVFAIIRDAIEAHPNVIEVGGYEDHPCCAAAIRHSDHVTDEVLKALIAARVIR